MRYTDLIDEKKKGKALSKEEIDFFIKGVVSADMADYQISAMLMAIAINGMDFEETLNLTLAMRDSGEVVELPKTEGFYVDKHSTGGVGDSTTFVVLPALAALGLKIVKMSGRGLGHTGGTIDKLEAIPGYRVELSKEEVAKQARDVGLVLVGQTGSIAPADKILYALRDVTATVDSIPLIVSSIMSKKLASGSDVFVFDVKYGNGAFLKTKKDAQTLADWLVKVGGLAGKRCSAVLSDMNQPLDEYVGNSLEVLGALNVLKGEKNDLYKVSKQLVIAALLLADKTLTEEDAGKMFDKVIASGAAFEKFKELVLAQGGDGSFLEDESNFLTAKFEAEVLSDFDGTVSEIDTTALGNVLVQLGGGRLKKGDLIDLSVGFKMNVRLGSKVKKGDSLAVMYFNSEAQKIIEEDIKKAIIIN